MIRKIIQTSRIDRFCRSKHKRKSHTLANLQPTITRQCYVSTQTKTDFGIPLSISDVHLRHEQLPFAYFFDKVFSRDELEASLYETLKHFSPAGGVFNYQTIMCTTDDTVPLTFAEFEQEMTMEKWLVSDISRNHYHSSENGQHPTLNQLFQPLFTNDDTTPLYDNLMTIQVTKFANDTGTSIGINTSHLLGDTASCFRFAECWGKAHSQEVFSSPCFDRSYLSCSGMMTEDISDSLNLDAKAHQSWWNNIFASNEEARKADEVTLQVNHSLDHEYIRLEFTSEVLDAMKEHAMKACEPGSFISTNDTIMAASWMFKRALSKSDDSNLSIVVNLRGKCGIDDFDRLTTEQKSNVEEPPKSGLFGNGITNFVVSIPPTTSSDSISMSDIAKASISIRRTLIAGLEEIPSRISHSRIGIPIPSTLSNESSSSECFSVTSWRQFSSQDISFAPDAKLVSFHGQPSHPLPKGTTYSSVVHNDFDDDGNVDGSSIELFMPSSQIDEVIQIHSTLCSSYLKWNAKKDK